MPLYRSPFVVLCAWEVQSVALDREDIPSARDAPTFENTESAPGEDWASLRNGCAEAKDEVTGAFYRPFRNLTVRNGNTVP
jgi:hypothetical protein